MSLRRGGGHSLSAPWSTAAAELKLKVNAFSRALWLQCPIWNHASLVVFVWAHAKEPVWWGILICLLYGTYSPLNLSGSVVLRDSRHLWRLWISLCFFETTIMTSIFPSKYSLRSQFFPSINVESLGNYHYVFIHSQPTEAAVVLEQAATRRDGRKDGRRDGWMAAEEVYSCLWARRRSSRRSLWRRPSCRHAANTKQLHVRLSWAHFFTPCLFVCPLRFVA